MGGADVVPRLVHSKQLREIQPRCIRVLLTGRSDSGVIVEAVNRGEVAKVVKKPFETKDLLKSQSFRWSPEKKVWWKLIPATELAEMRVFMEQQIYKGSAKHTG